MDIMNWSISEIKTAHFLLNMAIFHIGKIKIIRLVYTLLRLVDK